MDMTEQYSGMGVVDIPKLCAQQPRLATVRDIARKNRFMHWELEFADLFAERGGFDLVIGNPPWIKVTWEEKGVLSDKEPLFAVRNLSANQTTNHRAATLDNRTTYKMYFREYESMTGEQLFLNAAQNYYDLLGQQTNLYKCFLPQAWQFGSENGVSAFVHPDGVYDDSKGGGLREKLYPRLRMHFQFQNEKKLFSEVANRAVYSLNIYSNAHTKTFDSIANLFEPSTIEECYLEERKQPVGGIKTLDDKWNITGHPDRVLHIGKKELSLFAKVFDDNDLWMQARLPVLHTKQYLEVLNCFSSSKLILNNYSSEINTSVMWDETNAQNDGTIQRNVHFPEGLSDLIFSGPHIGIGNPFFQSSQEGCSTHRAYDTIDLTSISETYYQRCNYSPACNMEEYVTRIATTSWGEKHFESYRIITRSMLNLSGERTLYAAIIPPKSAHINTTFSFAFKDLNKLLMCAGAFASIPYDFMMKITGKGIAFWGIYAKFPFVNMPGIELRILLLNALTNNYASLWNGMYNEVFCNDEWSKKDYRLNPDKFSKLSSKWSWSTPLRTDYERRQVLIEIDVLVAIALDMTLEQLKIIYRIQFPVLQQYEADTWYDANGRIVFTNNRSLANVGFNRPEWENGVKDAPAGKKFYRTIIDDTQPGGPVERTIEYVAPFDRCDREQDYETAWKFFEEKYGGTK